MQESRNLREWIVAAKLGDHPAQARICRFVAQRLTSQINRLAGSGLDALEIVAETQFAVLQGLPELLGPESILSYARGAATNIILARLREKRKHARIKEALKTRKLTSPSVAHQNLEASELLEALKDPLTPQEKVLFRLEFVEKRPREDIAEQIGITPNALACRSYRLRSKLQTAAERYLGNGTQGK